MQLENTEIRNELGIDCVVISEGEKVAGSVFGRAVNDEQIPDVVYGEIAAEDEIPLIKGATIDGIVEIALGCGRGCDFCVPTLQRYRCLPISHILKEVEVNLRAGRRPLLHAEDVFRYKAKGFTVNKEAVTDLFKTVKEYSGVDAVGISHFALSSVASAPDIVEEVSNILEAGKDGGWLSGQTGIETGSPRLIKDHMKEKCKPFSPEDWPQVVIDAFDILSRNCWVPFATLIIGLPGETEKDIDLTIDLLGELKNFKSLIVPLFLVSMGGLKDRVESFTLDKMIPKHSELFLRCWEHNLNWGNTLLKEYFIRKSGGRVYGLRLVFSYAINQGKKLIRKCQDDYGYDLPAMIQDSRNGKISVAPAPIRFIYRLLR